MAQSLGKIHRAINRIHHPQLWRRFMQSAFWGELFTQPRFTWKVLLQALTNKLVNGHIYIGDQLIVFF